MARFMEYDWRGNVRELKSALEYAFVLAEEDTIQTGHLPRHLLTPSPPRPAGNVQQPPGEPPEKQTLVDALTRTRGNQSQAARMLGINRVTVWTRIKKYGIDIHALKRGA